MLRKRLKEALTLAMEAQETHRVSTIRLVMATIEDRDFVISVDETFGHEDEREILIILQKMICQRKESIDHYEKAGRVELAAQEQEEIAILREFLPTQIVGDEMLTAIRDVIDQIGAEGIKAMGPIMVILKERYAGRMDFAKAGVEVKRLLNR